MKAKGWLALVVALAGCASSETYALEDYLNRIHLEEMERSSNVIKAAPTTSIETTKSHAKPAVAVPVRKPGYAPARKNAIKVVKVRKGDQLYKLARRYGVSAKEVIALNNLKRPYDLKIGQKLKLPNTRTHVVKKGEYLYQLADKYNVSLAAIVRENNLKRPYNILIGQKLRIPASLPGKNTIRHFAANKAAAPSATRQTYAKAQPIRKSTVSRLPKAPVSAPRSFIWPVEGKVISRFGKKGKGVSNEGVNIAAPQGSNVKAAASGVVVYTGSELKSFGNMVIIRHGGGWLTAYAHQSDVFVPKGAVVKKGQVIGRVGNSGKVKSPQLHFSIRKGKKPVDPQRVLKG